MPRMLASVRSLAEARLVLEAGVDIVDIKEPSAGALGAVDVQTVAAIAAAVGGRVPVSATVGDLAFEAEILEPAVRAMAATGVDIVKVGVFSPAPGGDALAALARLAQDGMCLVAVMFAEFYGGPRQVDMLAGIGLEGIMLDTAEKSTGPLTRKLAAAALHEFIDRAGRHSLLSGLAGSLTVADIPVLAALGPDFLGFRGVLCGGRREGRLDLRAVRAIHGLMHGALVGSERNSPYRVPLAGSPAGGSGTRC